MTTLGKGASKSIPLSSSSFLTLQSGSAPPDQSIGMKTLAFLHVFLYKLVFQVSVVGSPTPRTALTSANF